MFDDILRTGTGTGTGIGTGSYLEVRIGTNLEDMMMNLMNLMMIFCNSTYLHVLTVYLLLYTAPELTVPYHLSTPVRNMSSAHLLLLASFVVRKALECHLEGEGKRLIT